MECTIWYKRGVDGIGAQKQLNKKCVVDALSNQSSIKLEWKFMYVGAGDF